ncbi:MAG: ubiquinone/menaquinone biosynthesis methyltransferase [Gemmatimonadaceae bacterium]
MTSPGSPDKGLKDDLSKKHRETAAPAPFRLGNLDVEAHLADPKTKQAFVTPMFDVIAPKYDMFTRVFSFGMDVGWKKEAIAVAIAHASKAHRALDLACGTGDFSFALATQLPALGITGIDASPRMVEEAVRRLQTANAQATLPIRFEVGDMMSLNASNSSVDLITAGYGVRNVPNAQQSVREMARVLKSGGTLVTLDFYRPELSLWRKLLLGYLSVAGNAVGWLWYRDPIVYGYIAKSIEHFMSWQAFSALLVREGFVVNRVVRHLGGGIALHIATRV